MSSRKLLPFALLAISAGVFAQQAPSAGSQMQQIPPAPLPQKLPPKIEIQPAGAPVAAAAESIKIVVNSLNVTGAQVYSASDLIALSGFRPGSEMTLSDLRGMANKIAAYYHQNGYFVAQAYLPAQDINGGAVTIAVIEGRYSKVTLQNQSKLSDAVAERLLVGLNSGDLIASEPLESRLLLLSDIPGVQVKSTLLPGTTAGTSELIVNIVPGKTLSGEVDIDNAGNRYTGEYRLGTTLNLNNLAGLGDVASLRAMTTGSELSYGRASYQLPFGRATAGVAYSYLDYSLGREFESLGAHGTAKIASVFGSYSLIRSRNTNLYARLTLDDKTFHDKVDLTSSITDKKARALTASLAGEHRDKFAAGGVSAFSLAWTSGNLNIQTDTQRAIDAVTARSNGHYNKLGFSAMRLQNLTDTLSLYGAVSGQFASKNLDVSEKMSLGGMYGVRAYPEGEAYADQGYLATVEARLMLPNFSDQMSGRLQLIAFADSGTVTIDKNPWVATANRRTLSGAGIGFNWTDPDNFMVRAYWAHQLGNQAALSAPDKSGRFWIQAVKYF